MGFFDNWKSGPEAEPIPETKPTAAEARPAPPPQPAAARTVTVRAPQTQTQVAPPTKEASRDMPEFGIQKAIELMRQLPTANSELVVAVVKTTLESMNIDVESIIADAKAKQAKIEARVSGLEGEIAELREEIAGREQEIAALKADFAETSEVRKRLQLAQPAMAAPADPPPARGAGVPRAAPLPNTGKHLVVPAVTTKEAGAAPRTVAPS